MNFFKNLGFMFIVLSILFCAGIVFQLALTKFGMFVGILVLAVFAAILITVMEKLA